MAPWLSLVGSEFRVLSPPELAEAVGRVAERMQRSAIPPVS